MPQFPLWDHVAAARGAQGAQRGASQGNEGVELAPQMVHFWVEVRRGAIQARAILDDFPVSVVVVGGQRFSP